MHAGEVECRAHDLIMRRVNTIAARAGERRGRGGWTDDPGTTTVEPRLMEKPKGQTNSFATRVRGYGQFCVAGLSRCCNAHGNGNGHGKAVQL